MVCNEHLNKEGKNITIFSMGMVDMIIVTITMIWCLLPAKDSSKCLYSVTKYTLIYVIKKIYIYTHDLKLYSDAM